MTTGTDQVTPGSKGVVAGCLRLDLQRTCAADVDGSDVVASGCKALQQVEHRLAESTKFALSKTQDSKHSTGRTGKHLASGKGHTSPVVKATN